MRRSGHHGSVAVVCVGWRVRGGGSALRTSTMPRVWADSTVSYFHVTPKAHWRWHLRRWTRWRLQAAERGYPGMHTSAGLKLTFCRCMDNSGHHPASKMVVWLRFRGLSEALPWVLADGPPWCCTPTVSCCLRQPSFGFLQVHQDVFGFCFLPQFAHFQCRFHMHTCLRQLRSRHLQS